MSTKKRRKPAPARAGRKRAVQPEPARESAVEEGPAGEATPPVESEASVVASGDAATALSAGGAKVSLGEWWDEDPLRERALEMVYQGNTNKAIAHALGVHRNTVRNWRENPHFVELLAQLQGDKLTAMRARRSQQTMAFTERIAKLSEKALTKAEEEAEENGEVSRDTRVELQAWMGEFRAMRSEERTEHGDNISRHSHHVEGSIDHQHTHSVRRMSFKDYVAQQIAGKVIDVEALNGSNDEPAIALVERVLSDTDIIDIIAEEDRIEEQRKLLGGGDK